MNTTDLAVDLKDMGVGFTVNHFRYLKNGGIVKTYNHSKNRKKHGVKPEYNAKGGMTVIKHSGFTYQGDYYSPEEIKAICGKKDNFDFKMGYRIALARLHKKVFMLQ